MDSGSLPDDAEGAAVYYPLKDGYCITWRQEQDGTWTAIGEHDSHRKITKHASTLELAINLVKDEIDEHLLSLKNCGS